jgi:hypothetical protein
MKINTMIAFAALLTLSALNAAEPLDPARFEKEILVPAARDAIQMEVLPGGDVIFAEFWGTIKRWDAKSGGVSILGTVPTYAKGEIGLLGMAVARDFEQSGHVYALFAPTAKLGTVRVSRFTVKDGRMAAESELELLSWPYDTEHVFHMGGAMWMDGKGDLYIGNGDNCHYDPGLPQDTRPAGIGVIRVSGPQAGAALAALAGRVPQPRRATLAKLRDHAGALLDEALVLWFPGPDTATGEDLAELHCHGGRAVIAAVEGALAALPGLRRAEPGEFTRRAFANGRIDLAETEGLADLLSAETELARAAALANAGGALSRQVEAWLA